MELNKCFTMFTKKLKKCFLNCNKLANEDEEEESSDDKTHIENVEHLPHDPVQWWSHCKMSMLKTFLFLSVQHKILGTMPQQKLISIFLLSIFSINLFGTSLHMHARKVTSQAQISAFLGLNILVDTHVLGFQ